MMFPSMEDESAFHNPRHSTGGLPFFLDVFNLRVSCFRRDVYLEDMVLVDSIRCDIWTLPGNVSR
jgi:hypothetical protein